VVLEHHLIEKADSAKGRFRTLLLVALDRYVRDVRDRESARKRKPKGRLFLLDIAEPPEVPQSIVGSAPESTFHYACVSALLEQVFEEVEHGCHRDGQTLHWCVFRDRVLDPIMDRSPPPSLKEIVAQYGVQDESKVSNRIVTIKRRFRTALTRILHRGREFCGVALFWI